MSWRERLAPASFRGVKFHVETAELHGGRRTVLHEYPLRSEPYVEDMGRRARGFPVDGYVLGEDYLEQRDALVEALETEGPGELLHPYHGGRRVVCSGFTVRESTSEGGIARFAIDFVETPAQPIMPSAVASPAARVLGAAAVARQAAREEFLARYRPEGLPLNAYASASAVLASASSAIDSAIAPVMRGAQNLAEMRSQVLDLEAQAISLARQPLGVLAAIEAAISSVSSLPSDLTLGLRALLGAYGFTPTIERPLPSTPVRAREAANYDALLALIRLLLALEAARLSVKVSFDSYDAAAAARERVTECLDEQAVVAGDDLFQTVSQVRAELVRALPGERGDLPRLLTHRPIGTVPSLVLAHQLYGGITLEADIVARNRVLRPGFIAGGSDLEVLSHG